VPKLATLAADRRTQRPLARWSAHRARTVAISLHMVRRERHPGIRPRRLPQRRVLARVYAPHSQDNTAADTSDHTATAETSDHTSAETTTPPPNPPTTPPPKPPTTPPPPKRPTTPPPPPKRPTTHLRQHHRQHLRQHRQHRHPTQSTRPRRSDRSPTRSVTKAQNHTRISHKGASGTDALHQVDVDGQGQRRRGNRREAIWRAGPQEAIGRS
jgi:outer membrane biosynthesis protein TonB